MRVLDDKQAVPPARPAAARRTQTEPGEDNVITDGFVVPDLEVPDDAPPAYGQQPDQIEFSQPGFQAGATITNTGRVSIQLTTKNNRLAELLGPVIARQAAADAQPDLPPAYIPPSLGGRPGQTPPPQLNVVIQIVGSRGDVQPFVALGKVLKETYGHRVRVATHPVFQPFVEENGLEFFSIGGDPAELMAFMVKHPGLMPGFDAVKTGEVSKRRRGIAEILVGCWRSCIEAGDGLGPPPPPHHEEEPLDLSEGLPGDDSKEPFVADAIIANPPSFAHIHIAEKLGIPLHMMFTMPWSPTRAFPHPLADIKSSNADDVMTNYLTYTLVEMLTWQGLGDIINRFREKALALEPLSLIWAPGLLSRLKIPYTYCWSPALIEKPNDWKNNIDISGFFFLNLASSYTPDPELAAFLEAGPPPVYIGFGSIVVDDPDAMTKMIFEAVSMAGVRAFVSKGWGGLGADDLGKPDSVFMLGNVPHDWLFEHVSCVVHHGGAGTTAAGIKAGKPTFVVPFFGDQPFWGAMIARANAGPGPVKYKDLTAQKLAESIKFCLESSTQERAQEMGAKIREEKGTDVGGKSFHSQLDMDSMRCSLAPSRAAAWRVRRSDVRLSPLAAIVLMEEGCLKLGDLKLYRPREYNTEAQPPDPISAAASSLIMDASGIGMAIADMPRGVFRAFTKKDKDDAFDDDTPNSGAALGSGADGSKGASTTSLATRSGSSSPDNKGKGPEIDLLASHSRQPSGSDQQNSLRVPSPKGERGSGSESRKAGKRRGSSPVDMSLDAAVGAGKNVGRIVGTGVKSPMNFCLGLAKGFRNIPRLYNDETVRPIEKVTDLSSGIRVAGKEFGFGLYDGISGLVTQPLQGAEKEGIPGLVKGFGKGIGGLITKVPAGAWSIPAYTMQGVHAQIIKLFSRSAHNYIISSRVSQGMRDAKKATEEERRDIVMRWRGIDSELKLFNSMKRREKPEKGAGDQASFEEAGGSSTGAPRTGFFQTRHLPFEARKMLHAQKEAWAKNQKSRQASGSVTPTASETTLTSEDAEFERAIQASVQETSRGNAEEDAIIEQVIRESVDVARKQGGLPDPVPSSSLKDKAHEAGIFEDAEFQITDEEYQALIQQAISQSMGGEGHAVADSSHGKYQAVEGQDPDDDEEFKRAIEESRQAHAAGDTGNDEEFERAIAASKQDEAKMHNERTEEDIVLEYVQKQSLAEEELRKKHAHAKGKSSADGDDEDMRRAMEESLRMSGAGHAGPSGI